MNMDQHSDINDVQRQVDAKLPLKDREKCEPCTMPVDSPVKSTAVVKYSAVQCPATFAQLQCNTDLNSPPSNWLSSSAESYGLQHVSANSSGFSSFRLAHMFPDCVGQVDVVSDAENIKKLLKIPYSRGAVSMMVHRVENTLLIDEFDIHKLLLHQSKTDWEWLREFFISNVLQSMSIKEKGLLRSHRRAALQSRLLVSKFLHHSLVAENPSPPPPLSEPSTKLPVSTEPILPEPKGSEELPDPGTKHNFLRNVVWTFENIQMLIGTDMPIFGGSTHPCISLRLCDMAKPISVLTGIDYWLDNLMSNVPEVVMCFHLAGIVQRYELVKTEDLPHLSGSRFSPKVIRDVAQHILSFLKTNVAKAGHTYWLFKGKDEDVVKLYDLTSLCCGSIDEKGQNPFTVPVAMLLYRVARNMKQSADARQQHGTIHMLLDNCVRLLDAQKYPQIATSAHYMLADLYIPSTTDPADPVFDDRPSDVEPQKECKTAKRGRTSSLSKSCGPASASSHRPRRNSFDGFLNIPSSDTEAEVSDASESGEKKIDMSLRDVKSLNLSNMQVEPDPEESDQTRHPKSLPLSIDVQERCQQALRHIAVGLQCLQLFEQPVKEKDAQKERNSKKEDIKEPQMAKPFEPIPMPYSPLGKGRPCMDKNVPDVISSESTGSESSTGKKVKNAKNSILIETVKKCAQQTSSPTKEVNGIKKFLCPSLPGRMPTWQTPDVDDNVFWNAHLKILLYEKTCLVYATLAEQSYMTEKYGLSLRAIGRVLRCRQVLARLMGTRAHAQAHASERGLVSYLLGRAGDCCFMLVQRWPRAEDHRRDLVSNSGVDAEIEHEMFRDCPEMDSVDLSLVPEKIESIEQILLASLQCYDRAKSADPKQDNLYRRIGNVHNELGVLYMSQAAEHYQHLVQLQADKKEVVDEGASHSFKELFNKSLEHLEAGVKAFEVVSDSANLALLHSNTGRLLRLCAHFHEPILNDVKGPLSQERRFYNKALASYQKALQVLGNRKSNPAVWDTVMWELSTALYNLAVMSQDYPGSNSKSPEDAERTAVDLLQRALKYCDIETPGPRQPVYQFRVASIHHRLGSLYHKSFRNLHGAEESRHAKGVLQSCRLHYEKACEMFSLLENAVGYFTVQLERVALAELQAQNAVHVAAKLRSLHLALELLLSASPMLACVATRQSSSKSGANSARAEKPGDEDDDEEELKLLKLFEQRLQMILLTATKLSSSSGKKDLECAKALYKKMYSVCLHAPGTLKTEARVSVSTLAAHLLSIVTQLEPFMKEMHKVGK